jgi:hypothetical protein
MVEHAPNERGDDLIDEWGEDSVPASDPPGSLAPSLEPLEGPPQG